MSPSKSNPLIRLFELVFDSRPGKFINSFLLLPVLVLTVLVLPPFAIPDRLLSIGYTRIDHDDGGMVEDLDGASVTFLPEAMDRSIRVKLTAIPRQLFLEGTAGNSLLAAVQNIPPHLIVKSPYYRILHKGTMPEKVIVRVPIPNEAEPYSTLDLYAWNGESWAWLPHRKLFSRDIMEAELDYLPGSVVVMQTRPVQPEVATDYSPDSILPDYIKELPVEINPQGLQLDSNGRITDNLGQLPPEIQETASFTVLPTLRNWDETGPVRSDLIDNLLVDSEAQERHLQEIVRLIQRNGYAGIDLDYRGINPRLQAEYTLFLTRLRETLPDDAKLSVRVELPQQISADMWETGAYNWLAIGRLADVVKIPTYPDPRAYPPGGQMETMLDWAVGQIDRYKLQLLLPTSSTEQAAGVTRHISYQQALEAFGAATIVGESPVIAPGQDIAFTLQGAPASTGVQFDEASGTYWLAYLDDNQIQHTVYLENTASMARKLQLVTQYNLRGVAIQNPGSQNSDPHLWEVVQKFVNLVIPPVESQYAVIWRIQNEDGGVIAEEMVDLSDPNYRWTAPEAGGAYRVGAVIAAGHDSQAAVPRGEVAILVATPTPIPTPTPLPTPTPIPASPTPTPEPQPEPAKAQQQAAAPAKQPAAAPAVASAVGNLPFDYGIQVDPGNHKNNVGQVQGMGFRWVKLQMPWKYVEPEPGNYQWGTWDEIIGNYARNGIKVMLSIPKAPDWARPSGTDFGAEGPPADPNTYAKFVGLVAQRYSDGVQAIEVWNEQNIDYEWGREPFDPARYMELLKVSYNAIKAANPGMIVVSGAPTPTGAPPPAAMDDQEYLRQMYAHGLKQYSDAIGAHPSGFANPPDALFTGGDYDPNRGYDDHRSFFFRNTMEAYRQIMVENGDSAKTIWPTEFGWPVMRYDDGRFPFAAENSLERQAQWTVQAYQLGKQWGWVGTMFLWNLDYNATAGGTELANFGIVGTPTYDALANMPK
ncbi:MAG: cellulase family glycosylhydrolase [Anaerolineae bacterium]|nr:cellulase family glycosylhydrolase [Anaerolineae bacterium]